MARHKIGRTLWDMKFRTTEWEESMNRRAVIQTMSRALALKARRATDYMTNMVPRASATSYNRPTLDAKALGEFYFHTLTGR